MPDDLAVVGLHRSLTVGFSFASAFQLFLAVESLSWFHLCIRLVFVFSEMLH